jgi:thiol-disulfide isomerase/thioredoxin
MIPKNGRPWLAVALLFAAPLGAADEKTAVPFRPLAFDAACATAKAEGKLIFIDFYTTWCEPCKRLDKDTWTNADVGKLVGEKAVALKLDAEKEGKDVAKRYKITAYPTLLLLKPDGIEVDRIIGYREPAKFTEEFSAGVAGRPALVRAAEAVASVPAEGRAAVQARYNFAKTLAQNGKYAEALEQYLWCYDEGMVREAGFAGVRVSFLTGDLGRLAAQYPPTREALIVRRDNARARLLASAADRQAATEFSALNEALGDRAANLALFDQFPAGDARRRGLGLRVYAELVTARRYADALEVQPYETMRLLLESGLNPSAVVKGEFRETMKAMSLKNAATNVEALAGGGELDHAREFIARILAADSSAEMKALLREKLARAGHPELLTDPGPTKP